MASVGSKPPLVVIVGPTASGKSGLAMDLAARFSGEIICSDSRTIYKGLDVGTAKPSAEDRARVPHWGLDLVEPGERFSAADFKAYAQQKIEEVRARGHVPFLVGGTGLYVDAVVYDYQFGKMDSAKREMLEKLSLKELHRYCKNNNVGLPENAKNRRYVIRAIERGGAIATQLTPIDNIIVVGIATEPLELRARIEARAAQLFETGMVEEARKMGERYGWDSEAMTGNIYRLVRQYLDGEYDHAELRARFATADWQLAKRQRTYFARREYIHWLPLAEATQYIQEALVWYDKNNKMRRGEGL